MNNEQRKHQQKRYAISDNVISLLERAPGLDLLRSYEQESVLRKVLPLTATPEDFSEVVEAGFTLERISMAGAHFSKFDRLFYPVAGYPAAYEAAA